MTTVSFRIPMAKAESLFAHLHSAAEQVAFLRGLGTDDPGVFEVTDVLELTDDELDYRSFHVSLADHARQQVFSWASQRGDILVEAHSHGSFGDPAAFSLLDLEGLSEWVPHVRWRLGNRPYAALVFGGKTFDGLAWIADNRPVVVGRLEIIGGTTLNATGRSYRHITEADDG